MTSDGFGAFLLTSYMDGPLIKMCSLKKVCIGYKHDTALYAEQILNKIANTFDGTYAGLKSMLQRFRIGFA